MPSNKVNRPKIPRIDAPIFSGKPEDWPRFWQLFKSLFDESDDLTPIEKYQYLITHVTGDAAKLLSALPFDGSSYDTAISTLKQRYEDERFLIEYYLRQLVDCAPVKYDGTSLQATADLLRQVNTALDTLRIGKPQLAEEFFLFLITSKFENRLIFDWAENRQTFTVAEL